MSNNFVKSPKEVCLLLVSCGKPGPCKESHHLDPSVGQKERFLEMQYCLICEGLSLNHTLYPNLVINFIQQESTEYKKKIITKNNTWRLESQEALLPKRNTASFAARHSHCLLSHTSTASQSVLIRHRGQEYTKKLLSNHLKIFRVLTMKLFPDTMKLSRKNLRTWMFFSFHKYTLKDRFTVIYSNIIIVSMFFLSSTQSHWSYKLGKFTCYPSLHLDGLNFSCFLSLKNDCIS